MSEFTVEHPNAVNSIADADYVIAFDYGDGGVNEHGQLMPGVANKQLALYLSSNIVDRETVRLTKPLYAQTLIGGVLTDIYPELLEDPNFHIVPKSEHSDAPT